MEVACFKYEGERENRFVLMEVHRWHPTLGYLSFMRVFESLKVYFLPCKVILSVKLQCLILWLKEGEPASVADFDASSINIFFENSVWGCIMQELQRARKISTTN